MDLLFLVCGNIHSDGKGKGKGKKGRDSTVLNFATFLSSYVMATSETAIFLIAIFHLLD